MLFLSRPFLLLEADLSGFISYFSLKKCCSLTLPLNLRNKKQNLCFHPQPHSWRWRGKPQWFWPQRSYDCGGGASGKTCLHMSSARTSSPGPGPWGLPLTTPLRHQGGGQAGTQQDRKTMIPSSLSPTLIMTSSTVPTAWETFLGRGSGGEWSTSACPNVLIIFVSRRTGGKTSIPGESWPRWIRSPWHLRKARTGQDQCLWLPWVFSQDPGWWCRRYWRRPLRLASRSARISTRGASPFSEIPKASPLSHQFSLHKGSEAPSVPITTLLRHLLKAFFIIPSNPGTAWSFPNLQPQGWWWQALFPPSTLDT